MAKTISHTFCNEVYKLGSNLTFPAKSLPVKINYPGNLFIEVEATLKFKSLFDAEPITPIETPVTTKKILPWELIDPLGKSFTKSVVTLSDLNRYRNLRGTIKNWTIKIPKQVYPDDLYKSGAVKVVISGRETISSSSAAPIINVVSVINSKREFLFDLYRLGNLTVNITKIISIPFIGERELPSNAKISLLKPDGTVLKTSEDGHFVENITLSHLNLSRGQNGVVKKWKLIIETNEKEKHRIFAQVFETLTIPKNLLLDRIEYLLGKNGENFTLKGTYMDKDGSNKERNSNIFSLRLNSKRLAENLEFYDILDRITHSVDVDKEYEIYDKRIGEYLVSTRIKGYQLSGLSIQISESIERTGKIIKPELKQTLPYFEVEDEKTFIPKGLPKISIDIKSLGTVSLYLDLPHVGNWWDFTLVKFPIPDVLVEIAFGINQSGAIECFTWFDIKPNIELNLPLAMISYESVCKLLKYALQTYFAQDLNESLTKYLASILDNLQGGIFTYTESRWKNNAMEFDFVAGIIPERKQSPNYWPIVGHLTQAYGKAPNELKNTWSSPLLTDDPDKIKHIVVLMMENRSFDHVLGYLSLEKELETQHTLGMAGPVETQSPNAINAEVDGLTKKIINEFSDDKNRIRHLKYARFPSNAAGLKTKLPFGVGHEYEDVKQQLKDNTMKGFVDNFMKYNSQGFDDPQSPEPQDVLGYYTQEELAIYKYLADEYCICDNYFSSHPGATLPNRMFGLTGDLQKDRNGEPKFINEVDTSFLLSRELNIFDILTQNDVDWRVYESFPSVTMLRMFSRYAGEDKRISSIENLERDIAKASAPFGKFPSVVFIEPAMHDEPVNDDHPPADMLHGQHFIKRVYDALKSEPKIWNHTMFIINYDEHGGLFDHVPPKTAEILLDTVNGQAFDEKITFGVRVPAFIISPFVEKGSVFHETLDHTSVLKTILTKFCSDTKPFLSDRVNYAHGMGGALKSKLRKIGTKPPILPTLPDLRDKKSAPIQPNENFNRMSKAKLSSKDADFHELLAFLGRVVKPK